MLRGKNILLNTISESDLETLRNWRNQPELRQYFREHRLISQTMQAQWHKKSSEDPNQFCFGIYKRDSDSQGKLIGHCGLHYINWINRHAEFGIYLGDVASRQKGFGSDALRTLIRYGFNDLNLNRIWGEVYDNNPALAVYLHLGFKQEGLMRETYFHAGKYWNSNMISILRSDFDANTNS